MAPAHLQKIGVAIPEHDIHERFVQFAEEMPLDRCGRFISLGGLQSLLAKSSLVSCACKDGSLSCATVSIAAVAVFPEMV